jgi:L-ascorbate metabolism protein UlaG (beta-lactamase superfamily)
VFITHSHPDHYDLSTLLRLGRDVTIVVPEVERESLLAIDMAYRLRELGFTNVRSLRWHDAVDIGAIRVTALPFYGEQPTDGAMLHPEARNAGNTYVAEAAGTRIGLIADAGCDGAGSTITMAAAARDALGPLDVLFGGYRAWKVQPIRYLFSSVARYLLFVPPPARTQWQQIMNDADDLVQTAEAWGARAVVPYANGGTPWFERIGLGPREDESCPDDPRVDPPFAAVERAFAARPDATASLVPLPAGGLLEVA